MPWERWTPFIVNKNFKRREIPDSGKSWAMQPRSFYTTACQCWRGCRLFSSMISWVCFSVVVKKHSTASLALPGFSVWFRVQCNHITVAAISRTLPFCRPRTQHLLNVNSLLVHCPNREETEPVLNDRSATQNTWTFACLVVTR